jgi:hypothetical protein
LFGAAPELAFGVGFKSLLRASSSYNRFRVSEGPDTLYSPGMIPPGGAKLGSREVEIQDMQQPGFAGSVALQKLEKIWVGEYTYEMWSQADHDYDVDVFIPKLRAGMKKGNSATGPLGTGRRARVWALSDPRLKGLDVKNVTVEAIGPIDVIKPGKWKRTVKFHEWKKPIQLPLLKVEATAADKEADRLNAQAAAEVKALNAELDKLKKAAP